MEFVWNVVKVLIAWNLVWVPYWVIDSWSFNRTIFPNEDPWNQSSKDVAWLTAMNCWAGASAGLAFGYVSYWIDHGSRWILVALAYAAFLLVRGGLRGAGGLAEATDKGLKAKGREDPRMQ
jgi:hypothetical protein